MLVATALLTLPSVVVAQNGGGRFWLAGGHAAGVGAVAFSPDGSMVASASDDSTVKLWSAGGTLLRTLTTQPYQATALAVSPDGTYLAVGTYAGGFRGSYGGLGCVWLWRATNGWASTNVSLVRLLTNHLGRVAALAFSADGLKLASGGVEGSNVVRQVSNGALLAQRAAYNTSAGPAAANSVAFAPAGLFASGCEDNTIRAWNSSWTQVWSTNTAHSSNVTAVTFSPDGARLASASLDQTIRIWSTANWLCLKTLAGQTGGVTSLSFSPDGNSLAAGTSDGFIRLWNVASETCYATIAAHSDSVASVAFSPDGAQLVSGGQDNRVKTWSRADGTLLRVFGGQVDSVKSVAVSADGALCASAGNDQTIQVRSLIDGALVGALAGHTGCVSAITFSPNGTALASGGGPLDSTIRLWRLSDATLLRTIAAGTNGVMALAFSPEGSMLASGGDFTEKVIQLRSAADGSLLRTLAGHSNGVTALAFSPKGELLVSGGRRVDNTVKVWAMTNSSLIRTFTGHAHSVESVAFSPDGDTVASGSSGANGLKVWQVAAGTSRTFGNETNPVFFVAFSPDGSTLASASGNAIKLWNVASGNLARTITQEVFRVSCLAYSPNGNLIVYGREDATLAGTTNALGALGQPPLEFTSITVNKDGQGAWAARVQPRTHYVIQAATNLSDWIPLGHAASDTSLMQFTDSSTTNGSSRFYRAVTPP
jgi:WD40 repeat protein